MLAPRPVASIRVPAPMRRLPDHIILVLGCGANPDGSASPALERRLVLALREAQRDSGAQVLVSGGAVSSPAEGPAMQRWLVQHGVAGHRIWVEDKARFTLENIQLSAPFIAQARPHRITLVTERFHMPRASSLLYQELRSRGLSAAIVVAPAEDTLQGPALVARQRAEEDKLRRDLANQRNRDVFEAAPTRRLSA